MEEHEEIEERSEKSSVVYEYEQEKLRLATEEIERLKEIKRRLKELELPDIPKGLQRKRTAPKYNVTRNAKKLIPEYTSLYKTTSGTNNAGVLNGKKKANQKHNKSNTSYSIKIILEKLKPKPKPMLCQPLLIKREHERSKYIEKKVVVKNKEREEQGNLTYRIYVNAFKANKPTYHQSRSKLL